jgi:dienelactone hydrolase
LSKIFCACAKVVVCIFLPFFSATFAPFRGYPEFGCGSAALCFFASLRFLPFSSWVVSPLLWVLCAQSCSYPHKNLVFAHRVSDFKVLAQRHLVRQTRGMKMWPAMVLPIAALCCGAQTNDVETRLRSMEESLGQVDARLSRQMNELLWFQLLGDVAKVDKVRFTGPPPHSPVNTSSPAGSNDVIVSAFTFLPRTKVSESLPLIIFVHGEIHGNVANDEDAHVVRELVEQGYAVIAPDYRGSSGYGRDYWRQIDYGGLEIEDVHAARQWMLDRDRRIDARRVGIVGWSHGGLIALMTVFAHPESYQACYAGAPVSDLEDRIRLRGKDYEQLFAAPYHIGKTVAEAPQEYRRRSPAWNAEKLSTPLLVQSNANDEDVNLHEIEGLISALKKAGKDFNYHVYTNAPGGHHFNRLDTPTAVESRVEVWRFLARYLKPASQKKPVISNQK